MDLITKKISELPAAGLLDGTELLEVVKNATNRQTSLANIRGVVQTTGQSTEKVMSQKAVTDLIGDADNSVLPLELLTKTIKHVDTIDDLRNLEFPELLVYVSGYHKKDDGAFDSNIFKRVPHTNKVDNGGTTIVVSIGNEQYAYELQFTGSVHIKAFGAKGDGVHNDTMAFLSAFKHGIPIHSDKDSVHIFDRLMVTGEGLLHEEDKSVPVYAEAIKPLIYFNGNNCKIEMDPRIGEPAIYPLSSPRTLDSFSFYMLMFCGIDNIVLKNFKLQGGMFKNLLEDTKPVIKGPSGAVVHGVDVTINNTTGGIVIEQGSNILVKDIEITEVREAFNLGRVDNSRVVRLTTKNTYQAFGFVLCENIAVDDCHHKHARFQLSNAVIGLSRDLGIVLDNEGNTLYQVVPSEAGGGIKISQGHGIVVHGCQSMVFTDCSGYMSGEDCFRVQDREGVPSKNIKTYNYTSTRAMRFALSIYGVCSGIEHYSPKILEFRYKDNIIQPPTTREEALEGSNDINEHWAFNTIPLGDTISAILSRHNGMTIYDLLYIDRALPEYSNDRLLKNYVKNPVTNLLRIGESLTPDSLTAIYGGRVEFNNQSTERTNGVIYVPHDATESSRLHLRNIEFRLDGQGYTGIRHPILILLSADRMDHTMVCDNCTFDFDNDLRIALAASSNIKKAHQLVFNNCSFLGEGTLLPVSTIIPEQGRLRVELIRPNFNKVPKILNTVIGGSGQLYVENSNKNVLYADPSNPRVREHVINVSSGLLKYTVGLMVENAIIVPNDCILKNVKIVEVPGLVKKEGNPIEILSPRINKEDLRTNQPLFNIHMEDESVITVSGSWVILDDYSDGLRLKLKSNLDSPQMFLVLEFEPLVDTDDYRKLFVST